VEINIVMSENDVGNNVSGLGDDREMQRLLKMANALASDNMKQKDIAQPSTLAYDISKTIEAVQKSELTKAQEKPFVLGPVQTGSTNTAPKNATPEPVPNATSELTQVQMFNMFGYNLPKSTLYFILIAIAIAAILYYWTSPSKIANKDDADDKEDDKEDTEDE